MVGFPTCFLRRVLRVTATVALRPDSAAQRLLPTSGAVTLDRFLALTPALLLVAFSNGFQEEFLFRGLFLQKYNTFFDARVSNVLQAAIFSFAHAGVTYTPSALFFIDKKVDVSGTEFHQSGYCSIFFEANRHDMDDLFA